MQTGNEIKRNEIKLLNQKLADLKKLDLRGMFEYAPYWLWGFGDGLEGLADSGFLKTGIDITCFTGFGSRVASTVASLYLAFIANKWEWNRHLLWALFQILLAIFIEILILVLTQTVGLILKIAYAAYSLVIDIISIIKALVENYEIQTFENWLDDLNTKNDEAWKQLMTQDWKNAYETFIEEALIREAVLSHMEKKKGHDTMSLALQNQIQLTKRMKEAMEKTFPNFRSTKLQEINKLYSEQDGIFTELNRLIQEWQRQSNKDDVVLLNNIMNMHNHLIDIVQELEICIIDHQFNTLSGKKHRAYQNEKIINAVVDICLQVSTVCLEVVSLLVCIAFASTAPMLLFIPMAIGVTIAGIQGIRLFASFVSDYLEKEQVGLEILEKAETYGDPLHAAPALPQPSP